MKSHKAQPVMSIADLNRKLDDELGANTLALLIAASLPGDGGKLCEDSLAMDAEDLGIPSSRADISKAVATLKACGVRMYRCAAKRWMIADGDAGRCGSLTINQSAIVRSLWREWLG